MALSAEDRLIEWLRNQIERPESAGIGNDAAEIVSPGDICVTVDQQIMGTHVPSWLGPEPMARRLLAVNLSDLAAMGAQPAFGFVALSCPSTFEARKFMASLLDACLLQGVELAGGDLARADTPSASLTLIGRRAPRGRWLRRDAAQAGDKLWLGGEIGMSALGRILIERGARLQGGKARLPDSIELDRAHTRLARRAVLKHLQPQPQLELGQWLARRRRAAAIDISDGLALDLHRLCRESRVGALLHLQNLPAPPDFWTLCERLAVNAEELLLGGGEDYVLLFAIPASLRPPKALGCFEVGNLRRHRAIRLEDEKGTRPLPVSGWDHFDR